MKRDDSLQSMFEVQRVSNTFRRAVPRRIASVRPFKHISNYDANYMKTKAYEFAHLEEFIPCWTGEMAQRPIPFVSTDSRPLNTQRVFEKYIHSVLEYLLPAVVPSFQTINKISSLGYPIDANPGDGLNNDGIKTHQSKFDVVLELFKIMQHGDFSIYEHGYHTIGVRKQNEPPSKEREFQFIDRNGRIYQKTITAKEREIDVPQLGVMIGSRTRTIVRPPVQNLFLQCWDTLIHNAIMEHPLCDSNMYTHTEWPSDSHFVSFDCKHYERYMGLCAISYASAIGGRYEQQLMQMIHYPFIVPSDDWKSFFEISPQYRPGVYPQFSSGLSPVAPLGKLTNICVQTAYFHEVKGLDVRTSIATVLSGISDGMRRWSYGDDNRILGSKEEVDAFCSFFGDYLEIELDDTPQYLGMTFRRDLGKWLLPQRTYNVKFYQPERDYEFKEYPNLGIVERRAIFTKFGEPEISSTIIPYEDELWTAIGHPFTEIATAAVSERLKAAKKGIQLNQYMLTDKDYLMSEQQRIASGHFWHLRPDVTASIVIQLVGDHIRKQLTFRDAPHASVPEPDKHVDPFVQQETDQESEEIDYADQEATTV